jgi:hypothetical protein
MSVGDFLGNGLVSRKQLVLGTLLKTGRSKWETSCKKENINIKNRKKKEKRKKG